jgi:hypothetical protein
MKYFSYILTAIILCSVFSSCAAIGKVIQPGVWLGLLNIAAAGGITLFILRGSNK